MYLIAQGTAPEWRHPRGDLRAVPLGYVRRTHKGAWTPAARTYHASQNSLGAHLRTVVQDEIDCPVRVACAVWLDGVPESRRKGAPLRLTKSGNDWDGKYKALIDAMVRAEIIVDDSPYYARGPADLPDGTRSGVYLVGSLETPAPRPTGPCLKWAIWGLS